ncbi:hypothetical protein ABZ897_45450 [Nonomuraea sp. NPDC046802]
MKHQIPLMLQYAICPGIIDTEMMQRFTGGHALVMDGGQTT